MKRLLSTGKTNQEWLICQSEQANRYIEEQSAKGSNASQVEACFMSHEGRNTHHTEKAKEGSVLRDRNSYSQVISAVVS